MLSDLLKSFLCLSPVRTVQHVLAIKVHNFSYIKNLTSSLPFLSATLSQFRVARGTWYIYIYVKEEETRDDVVICVL